MAAVVVACPFCGHRAAPDELAEVVAAASPSAPAPASLARDRCPRCGGAPGAEPLRAEVWKRQSMWSVKRVRYDVLTVDLPGLCDDCAGWLRGRRWIATATVAMPLVVGAAIGALGSAGIALVTVVYGLYRLRVGTYAFADTLFYGVQLEESAREMLPRHPDGDPGSPRFPPGRLHGFLRGFFAIVVALGVAAAISLSRHHAR